MVFCYEKSSIIVLLLHFPFISISLIWVGNDFKMYENIYLIIVKNSKYIISNIRFLINIQVSKIILNKLWNTYYDENYNGT